MTNSFVWTTIFALALSGCGSNGCGGSDDKGDPPVTPPARCENGIQDSDETDIDCGGACTACDTGSGCSVPSDCASGLCEATVCLAAPACDDALQNQDETDVDCGGACSPCALGEICAQPSDCVTDICTSLVCSSPSCDDGLQNQTETGIDCGGTCDSCDVVLCADAATIINTTGSAPWTATGTLSADIFAPSCTSGHPSFDSVLRFVAPYAGTFRFSSAASAFDSILSVRSDCADAGTELACNDQYGLSDQAQVELKLADQEQVHLLVDAYATFASEPYTITVYEAAALPVPSIGSAEAFCNTDDDAIGLLISGTTSVDEVTFLNLQLLDSGGSPIDINGSSAVEINLAKSPYASVSVATGTFDLQLSAPMAVSMTGVASISVQVADNTGDYSAATVASCTAPVARTEGQSCDPYAGIDRCEADTGCAVPIDQYTPALCVTATAPTLTIAHAAFNRDRRSLGVSVEGADLESNAWYASVVLLDGELLPLREDPDDDLSPLLEPVLIEMQLQWVDDEFMGHGSRLLDSLVPRTVHFFAVRISVIDRTGTPSNATDASLQSPQALFFEDPCDLEQALGICPVEEVCAYDDGNVGSPTICQMPIVECPQDWQVTDLNAHPLSATSWQVAENFQAYDNYAGHGSCGGGTGQVVLGFVAQHDGLHSFALNSATPGWGNMLLFARSHCTLPQAEYELGCNDDIDAEARNLNSRVQQILAAGDQVYLFADSVEPFWGPYQLTVTFEGSVP